MPNLHDRWKNRRRMAWLSLIAGLLFPLLLLVTESEQLGAVATSFYMFVTGVVASYIGFATWDDVKIHSVDNAEDYSYTELDHEAKGRKENR